MLRYTLGIAPFSNHMERTVVLDMLLRLAPCAWALSPTMVANDNPSSATTAIYAIATDAFMCRAVLAVSEAWLALADFYYVAIGITHVAARLAVLFLRLCDKLGSSTAP